MSKQYELSSNHKRSLSVTSKAIEKIIHDLELLLSNKNKKRITEIIESVYSNEEKDKINKLLSELKNVNEEMFESLKLKSQKLYEDRIVYANLTYLWTILIDSKSDKLKRYGNVEKENAEIIDNYIDKLLLIVEILKKVST